MAKAETDYSDAKYPTSAKILDIIRCACVYDNCDDLVAGMNKVVGRIAKQDTELKKVCVVVLLFVYPCTKAEHFVCCFALFCFVFVEQILRVKNLYVAFTLHLCLDGHFL